MHRSIGAVIVICAFNIIKIQPQLVIPKIGDCERNQIGDVFCPDGTIYDYISCSCDNIQIQTDEFVRDRRSTNSILVSKLITDDSSSSTTASTQLCANNEVWNGKTCVSKAVLCPGGYQWNGNACIIQSTFEKVALVPSQPDTQCKHAQKLQNLANEQHLPPPSVMPIYSTSPACPFGYVWSDNSECVKQIPLCPSSYTFYDGACQLRPKPIYYEDHSQLIHPKPIRNDPDGISVPGVIDNNKWLQKPLGGISALPSPDQFSFTSATESKNDNQVNKTKQQNNQSCCSVISPRICRRTSNKSGAQWQCYNYKYKRCGSICTKPKIQLHPQKSSFVEPLLTMPPPPKRLFKLIRSHSIRPTRIGMCSHFLLEDSEFLIRFGFKCFIWSFSDCSGCLNGSFACSSDCFAYDCNTADCEFVDQDDFCSKRDHSDASNENYESDIYSDICAFTSS